MDFICDTNKWANPYDEPFNEMAPTFQMGILIDAYDEKKFRECKKHNWYLSIEYDNWNIVCDRCRGDYYYVDESYQEDISAYISVEPKRVTKKDFHTGEIADSWVEIYV